MVQRLQLFLLRMDRVRDGHPQEELGFLDEFLPLFLADSRSLLSAVDVWAGAVQRRSLASLFGMGGQFHAVHLGRNTAAASVSILTQTGKFETAVCSFGHSCFRFSSFIRNLLCHDCSQDFPFPSRLVNRPG